ncbi:LamG domain-containing protein [Brevifollis gellanilyticus]|nr:LamG domain-containing protein [Brevifollis gellanilyticus]
MKRLSLLLSALVFSSIMAADDLGELIFQDHFDRNESQETTDEPGSGWGTNSKTRAKGNKQVDLKDGTMRIFIHKEANHAVSVTHPAEFTDGAVGLRFMLEDGQDSLGLDFADLDFKEVHAGHLFVARISTKAVQLSDLKTGGMRLDISEARKAKQKLTAEQQAAMKDKSKSFPHELEVGKWHDLIVKVSGDTLSATIDGQLVGSFSSPGIAHPTKRTLRLSVPRNVVVDDVKIWRKK